MKEEKLEVALYWDGHAIDQTDCCRGFGTLSLSFVTVRTNEAGFNEVRNPSSSSWDGSPYADLQLHTQWNTDAGAQYKADCTYGESAYYKSPYCVGLHEAERMAKMLKRIAKVEEKFPVRPATFGQWVVLLCAGLGVKRLCVTEKSRGWHHENSHDFYPIAEAQRRVDDAIVGTFPKLQEIPQVAESA